MLLSNITVIGGVEAMNRCRCQTLILQSCVLSPAVPVPPNPSCRPLLPAAIPSPNPSLLISSSSLHFPPASSVPPSTTATLLLPPFATNPARPSTLPSPPKWPTSPRPLFIRSKPRNQGRREFRPCVILPLLSHLIRRRWCPTITTRRPTTAAPGRLIP